MIGILDSGLGGLMFARILGEQLPAADLVYLGDTGRAPYGGRSLEKIKAYADQGVAFLTEQGADRIVLPSLSISAAVLNSADGRIPVPLIEAVSPAARKALALSRSRRIGVVGTEAVAASRVFEKKLSELDPAVKVCTNAAPLLAPLIEESRLDKPETRMIVKKYLHPLKIRRVDVLIMVCNSGRLDAKNQLCHRDIFPEFGESI